MTKPSLPVAVIGAGPVGLAAAAHLLDRGLTPILFEAGAGIAPSVAAWGHVRMFSPWNYNVDAVAAAMLAKTGWTPPCGATPPTGRDLIDRYLAPLAALPPIANTLRLGHRVTAVARVGIDRVRDAARAEHPFLVEAVDARGVAVRFHARSVIDASGTWTRPGPAGASGLPAIGEAQSTAVSYGIPDVRGRDRPAFAGRRTLVVGAGHSAINLLLDLADLAREVPGTLIHWAIRRDTPDRAFGGGSADALAARGALGLNAAALLRDGRVTLLPAFAIERTAGDGPVSVSAEDGRTVVVDRVAVATGFRPDLSFLGELRLDLDPALECPRALGPLIDPNLHSCGSVRPHGARVLAQPEPGLYSVGMKSYGRAPTFLLATGHEQVRSVVAEIAGDQVAADAVHLVLPETGVCSARPREAQPAVALEAAACCPA